MKIDINRLDNWYEINEAATQLLGHSTKVYQSLAQAVYEMAMGTAYFYAHKKSVGMVSGTTNAFQASLTALYREGYLVQIAKAAELTDVKAWAESLKKDTSLVMFAEDHPITGELYDWQELDQLLNEKKIFSIRVSHSNHLFNSAEIKPYSVRICSQSPGLAYASYGNKFKSPDQFAADLQWNKEQVLHSLPKSSEQNKSLIESFESSVKDVCTPYFSNSNQRLFDRAVMTHPTLDGDAIRYFMIENLSRLGVSNLEQKIMTTSLCYWRSSPEFFASWWQPLPAETVLRGTLMLDLALIDQVKNLKEILKKSCDQCQLG